jgi:MFS family permease
VILSLAAFLNDAASEMITPLLPIFLTATLGAGPAIVGLVEGVAESASSLLKFLGGWLADRGWNSKGLVLGGYSVSNATRPLIGLAGGWSWVLGLRFLDRTGKGLRTSPRDAMIATAVPAEVRGRAFGFHRGMDHAGAVLGPLLAFLLLQNGAEMREVFLASIVPGLLVVGLIAWGIPATPVSPPPAVFPRLHWRTLDRRLLGLIIASGGLAIASVPEAFLVLWATERGVSVALVPLIWMVTHVFKAGIAWPAGHLSDRAGRLPVVLTGWGLRVAALCLIALLPGNTVTVWVLFLAFGASLAFTEAAERALIGDFAPPDLKATAFGLYHLVGSLLALPGAVLFGVLWEWQGFSVPFLTAALITALSAGALLYIGKASR